MHVSDRLEQLAVIFDRHAGESVLKNRSDMPRRAVEVAGIRCREPVHRLAEPASLVVQDKVNVIAHQAPRDDIYLLFGGVLGQKFQE